MEQILITINDPKLEDSLHIATSHLEISKEQFILQAIEIAITKHEVVHGGIFTTKSPDEMTIQAKDGVNLPNQLTKDEKSGNRG